MKIEIIELCKDYLHFKADEISYELHRDDFSGNIYEEIYASLPREETKVIYHRNGDEAVTYEVDVNDITVSDYSDFIKHFIKMNANKWIKHEE